MNGFSSYTYLRRAASINAGQIRMLFILDEQLVKIIAQGSFPR